MANWQRLIGSGWFKSDSLDADRMYVRRRNYRFRLLVLLVCAGAAVLLAPSAGAKQSAANWANPEIKKVVAHRLMASSVSSFKPNALLTQAELNELLPALPSDAVVGSDSSDDTGTTTTTDPSRDPTITTGSTTTTTTTTTTTKGGSPPGSPKSGSSVTVSAFDTALVKQLGLSNAAARFRLAARQAGLSPPTLFGTETVARLLGLRTNHPFIQDTLELLPSSPITRAEAAYSIAQVLTFTGKKTQWVEDTSNELDLPTLDGWQKRILSYAVSFIGYPYIWGGTSPMAQTVFGRTVPGGFDCSGFIWRVYKLRKYSSSKKLSSTIRGRTTYVMSSEVGRSKRIAFDALEPGDVLFFGSMGTRSKSWQITHTAIYLGGGWLIQSSSYGVALAPLEGWYQSRFAWARRPLAEAGLANVYSVSGS